MGLGLSPGLGLIGVTVRTAVLGLGLVGDRVRTRVRVRIRVSVRVSVRVRVRVG